MSDQLFALTKDDNESKVIEALNKFRMGIRDTWEQVYYTGCKVNDVIFSYPNSCRESSFGNMCELIERCDIYELPYIWVISKSHGKFIDKSKVSMNRINKILKVIEDKSNELLEFQGIESSAKMKVIDVSPYSDAVIFGPIKLTNELKQCLIILNLVQYYTKSLSISFANYVSDLQQITTCLKNDQLKSRAIFYRSNIKESLYRFYKTNYSFESIMFTRFNGYMPNDSLELIEEAVYYFYTNKIRKNNFGNWNGFIDFYCYETGQSEFPEEDESFDDYWGLED